MTDTELLALRVRAAERMGWKQRESKEGHDAIYVETCGRPAWVWESPENPHKTKCLPPDYTADERAAFALSDFLFPKGYRLSLNQYKDGNWVATFFDAERLVAIGEDPNRCVAIVVASLAVFERMDNEQQP